MFYKTLISNFLRTCLFVVLSVTTGTIRYLIIKWGSITRFFGFGGIVTSETETNLRFVQETINGKIWTSCPDYVINIGKTKKKFKLNGRMCLTFALALIYKVVEDVDTVNKAIGDDT